MSKTFKHLAGIGLALCLALTGPPAVAAPDTHVSNKQSFATDVIYQVVTDRFFDGNAGNNPTGSAFSSGCTQLRLYCGGDWAGLIAKINAGYFTGMGVTALWISQPVENIYAVINYSGTDNTAYHGYWGRDFKKPDPRWGTLTDFTNLINAAHAQGIKVIMDFAPNHTSPASESVPSFAENGKLYDNGALIAGYSSDPSQYFHHNGGTSFSSLEDGIYRNLYDLADMDHNKATIDLYFKAAIRLWLDLGVDGIRMDAVKHMPFGWQKNLMADVYAYKPVFTFGEWFLGENEVDPTYYAFANKNGGMSLLDFQLAQRLRQVFRNGTNTMVDLDGTVASTATAYRQPIDQVTFIDNHDMDRFQVSGANNRKLEQAMAFVLTSRGVPAIYYGTEQYMTGNGDPNNRAKMTSFSTSTTAYQLMAALAPLRKSNPALAYGTTQERWISNDVYIYERKFGAATVLVAINRNLSSGTSVSGLLTALPTGSYSDKLTGLLAGTSITVSAGAVPTFTLAAGAVAVWEYKPASYATPLLGHVGPMMGKSNNTITVDGRGFGATKGTVYFGATAVTGTSITSWEDTQIKVTVPAITPGNYLIKVASSGGTQSATYGDFQLLTGNQVSVRFVVNNAFTVSGENVYLTGSVAELTNWDSTNPIGACFNQVMNVYPSWYCDINVPANTTVQFKFIKKNGAAVVWEGGSNHSYTTPASGTGKVIVNWQ